MDKKSAAIADLHGMGACLEAFPAQCSHSLSLGQTLPLCESKPWNGVALCAMGGSALAADFIASLGQKRSHLPFAVVRDYALPPFVDEHTLVIALSYSGGTEETLTCYDEAQKRGATVAAVCSGGALMEKAQDDGAILCAIPTGFLPRMAFGYLSLPILMWLSRMGIVPVSDKEWFDCYLTARDATARYRLAVSTPDNPAKTTALALKDTTAVIWGSRGLMDFAARSMKNQINENAQCPAFWGAVPEVNHNEIMAMDHSTVVFLRDKGEYPRVNKRFELCGKLLRDHGCNLEEHWAQGETLPGRAVEALSYGAWVSYYLSLLRGVDPSAMVTIDDLKRAMGRSGVDK
ncbi:MAG: bifunctional phosphoglucose/phosphomannose isomerase [Bacillota bacterium]|nr:bifunctional phosphoglucose/phosphomannose isomerase [Bacillota bacterium]